MKEKQLKHIEEHNQRVAKGWTPEDTAKRTLLERSLELLEAEKTQKSRSAKKIAHERRRVKNDLNKLLKQYETIAPGGSFKKQKVEPILRARRMKVTPLSKESDDKLRQWIGTTRWVYNQCVAYSREHSEWASMTSTDKLRALRDNIANLQTIDDNKWFVESQVPYDVYDEGIRDFQKAWSLNMAKVKKAKVNGKAFKFSIGFRSKQKALRETIKVQSKHWGRGAQKFLVSDFKSREGPIPKTVDSAVTITLTRVGWYFSFPSKATVETSQYTPHEVVALDPGVRTFMTGYFSDGMVIEWGDGDMRRVYALLRRADQLHSKIDKGKQKYRRPWLRLLLKIRYKIDEIHRKFATFLCRMVKRILLPKFDTSRMVKRAKRNISSKTARSMMNWAHYRFRETLKAKVALYSRCVLYICDEHYTSKTCGSCGHIHKDLGKNKIFMCPKCAYTADRDINAARNILLRFLTLEDIQGGGSEGPFAPTGLELELSSSCMSSNWSNGRFGQ